MTPSSWFEAQFTHVRPKAVAALTRQFRDLDLAEEAFSTSCLKALKTWPDTGLPNDPLAWLISVAHNAALDTIRRRNSASKFAQHSIDGERDETVEDRAIDAIDSGGLRDDVLRLMFICCHPGLGSKDQLALALKIVAGMSVEQIAAAFLVKTKTMEQRITRAKKTVAAADVPFETPGLAERHARLKAVSMMLYLLFNEGWSASGGESQIKAPLCEEAIRLARQLLALYPAVSELMGLLAMFLFHYAKRSTRVDTAGELLSLDQQDRSAWDKPMIAQADALLEKALRHFAPGPYQIQAAIIGVHSTATSAQQTDWHEIKRLYDALVQLEPTAVVRLNRAVVVGQIDGPQAALSLLEPLAQPLNDYRWFHTAKAAFLMATQRFDLARLSYERACALGPTAPERRLMLKKIADCQRNIRLAEKKAK